MRWEQVVEQTRLALGESGIARYINDPDPNNSNIRPKNPILTTKATLSIVRSPSLEQLTTPEPDPQPEDKSRNQVVASRPEIVRPKVPVPSPTPEVISEPTPQTTPNRKPRIESSLDQSTLEVLEGWDVDRVVELLSIILPNIDSVTGAELPPKVEALTRMVVNMARMQECLPLVPHEDLLTNNEARLALEIMRANLTQHPEIKHLANLYRVYRAKLAQDQQQA